MHKPHLLSTLLLSLPLAYTSPITRTIITTETVTVDCSASPSTQSILSIPTITPSLPTAYALTTSPTSPPYTPLVPTAANPHNCACTLDDNTPGTAPAYLPAASFLLNGLPPAPTAHGEVPWYPISGEGEGVSWDIHFYTASGGQGWGSGMGWGSGYAGATGNVGSGSGYTSRYSGKPTGTGLSTAVATGYWAPSGSGSGSGYGGEPGSTGIVSSTGLASSMTLGLDGYGDV